jgi:histidine phosphotransferase ChpT
VGPLGAVVNGLEVMEDERDASMRADALKIVSSSAVQALARLQFLRIAFGAAGSAGAELDIGEVGRLVGGLLDGGKIQLDWQSPHVNWPKNWAKLLMNAALLGADCLPRGGQLTVVTSTDPAAPAFKITANSPHARAQEEVQKAVRGDRCPRRAALFDPQIIEFPQRWPDDHGPRGRGGTRGRLTLKRGVYSPGSSLSARCEFRATPGRTGSPRHETLSRRRR